MFDKNHGLRPCAVAFAVAVALGLSACGGGGGNVRPTSPPPPPPAGGTGFTGGEIDVDANSVTVLSGNYSGSIDLIKGGAGMLTLTGSNTYTGGTTINQGILQIGAGGTTGSITGNVVDNALLAFDRSDALTFDGVISGSGVLRQIGSGTLTLTGNNTYTGGTTISSGTLQIGDGGTTGSITGNVTDNAVLTFDRSDNITFGGIISGSGALNQSGAGTLTLTGANTYTGGTTVSSGTLQLGNGGTGGSIAGNVLDNGTLLFDRSDDVSFANVITGTGGLIKSGTGAVTFTGSNGYTGTTQIDAGTLYVDGDQSMSTGTTTVADGATLGGKGTVGGNVTVAGGGTLSPGNPSTPINTLTINGNLALSSGAVLNYDFNEGTGLVQPSDLINVKGNLVLDGTLNVSGYDLDPGVYRLINYSGTLSDNGLVVHGLSPGYLAQTGVAGQVNVISTQGMNFSFWDGDAGPANNGVINGGGGTWQNGNVLSKKNWTDADGAVNSAFSDGSFAVFQGAPGTVTVDGSNGDVNAGGMQFASNGYVIQGGTIHLVGSAADLTHSTIRVGDGGSEGAGYTATIDSVLDGNTSLIKDDAGTLVLGGDNTYTGGNTIINDGTLQIGHGGTAGSVLGDVNDNSSLVFNRSDVSTFDGVVSGTGSLTQAGAGTLILTGNNTYAGGTTVSEGFLQIGNGGTTGSITGNIANSKYVRFDRDDDVTFAGNISGTGSLLKDGAGALILTGAITEDSTNTSLPPTTITTGTLQIGNGGTTGSLTGDVTNNASLVFDRSDSLIFDGKVTGNGSMTQAGSGALILTNDNVDPNGIAISRGVLQVGNGGTTGTIDGNVANSGSLVFNYGPTVNFMMGYAGTVSGTGSLVKEGSGALILYGDSTYTGGTTISGGSLQLGYQGTSGSVVGNITNNGQLIFDRTDDVVFNGDISGSGSMVKEGFDSLTLTGNNTYTGDTTINQGVLQIGNGGTTGTISGNVILDGNLVSLNFDRANDFTYAGVLSGYGNVLKLGGGTMTVSGANTFSGVFSANDGVLKLVSGASVAAEIDVGGAGQNALLEIDHGANVSGTVLVQNQGLLDNSGNLVTTFAGGSAVRGDSVTVINHNGGLIQGDSSQPQTDIPGIGLGSNSTLNNDASSTIRGFAGVSTLGVVNNVGGTISGMFYNGIEGSATLVNNTAGGQITSGIEGPFNLHISSGINTNASSPVVNNLGGSTISGSAYGVIAFDGGTVTNDGASHISGDVAVSIGTSSNSTATINNLGGSTLSGTRAGISLLYGGTVTNGAGSTIQTSATPSGDCSVTLACSIYVSQYLPVGNSVSTGSLTLSNAGYIVGDVQMNAVVANNTLLMAGGYIHGALNMGSNAQSTLTLDGAAGTTQLYSSAVTGATTFDGLLAKNGAGTWVIDNSSLQDVVSTSINAGSLRSALPLSGDITVNVAGVLDSVPGVIGNLGNTGKVAVSGGDSVIGGNYDQSSAGVLAVSLGSKLAVNGSAIIGGTLEITGANAGYVSNTHTNVLTATGGVTGTFASLVKDAGVVFTSTTINYDASSVWLDTTGLTITNAIVSNGGTFTPASFGSAQRVQGAFDQLDKKIATGNMTSVSSDFVKAAGQFQQAPTVQAAQASLQSLSGQLHAASAAMTFEAIDASSRALSDRFDDLLGKHVGYGMWTHDLSVGGDMARAGFNSVGFQLNGWLVGNDRQIGRDGVAGYAFGQSRSRQQLEQAYDHDNSRTTEGMLYAGWLSGNWYTQGRVGFGHIQQDVNRQLLLGDSSQGVGTEYGGNYSVAYEEGGLHFGNGNSRVMPYVNVQYARIDRDGFAEQGAGGFGLRSDAQTMDRWQAGLGVRASQHWDLGGGRAVDFSARAQWQRSLAEHGEALDASFVGLQQWQPLVGIGLSRYSGLFGVGMNATLSKRTTLKFNYDYETGQYNHAQTLMTQLDVQF